MPAATKRPELFNPVLGVGRGGGQRATLSDDPPATGLARFFVHPGRWRTPGMFVSSDSAVAVVASKAQSLQAEAELLENARQAGWNVRGVTSPEESYVMAHKLFVDADAAACELQSLGAENITLFFYPTGTALGAEEELLITADAIVDYV